MLSIANKTIIHNPLILKELRKLQETIIQYFLRISWKKRKFSRIHIDPNAVKRYFSALNGMRRIAKSRFGYRPSRKRCEFSGCKRFVRVPWVGFVRRLWLCFISCHRDSWRSDEASCEGAVTQTKPRIDSTCTDMVGLRGGS